MKGLIQDVRYAPRQLQKNLGFTAVALLILAREIAANTAILSLVNTFVLRMLPVREPGQLAELLHRHPGEPQLNGFSAPAYQLPRDHYVFSGPLAAAYQPFHVRREGLGLQTVEGGSVDGSFFPVLGAACARAAASVYRCAAVFVCRHRRSPGGGGNLRPGFIAGEPAHTGVAIRLALGAHPAKVTNVMMFQTLVWIAAGAIAGTLCSLVGAGWIGALLFGIRANDPATLTEAALFLLVVALLASYIPAHRAAKVDPVVALRYERSHRGVAVSVGGLK